jgi:hypothetical protein
MSYLDRMYGIKPNTEVTNDKNPNRVTGGLRAQGVDKLTMVAEDGSSQELPSLAYVRSLEDQLRKQRAVVEGLSKKISRQDVTIQQINSAVMRRS